MSSAFSRLSLSCLFLALLLSGCANNEWWDNLTQSMMGTQSENGQYVRPAPAQPAPPPAAPPASNTANSGYGATRLDSQPWPPGMGMPLSGPGAYKPPKNAPVPAAPAAPTPNAAQVAPAPYVPSAVAPAGISNPNGMNTPNAKVQVAILLPLSGKNAPLGQAMLNAAQLAVFDLASNNFQLMPRDTGATTESAVTAARDAIASGAQLLIGPLFAADVAAVRPIVQNSEINMLGLSTDVSLATSGAYVMGFAPAQQVDRVIAYAAAHGMKRFAALIPSTPYGKVVQKAFEAAVKRADGTITIIETPNNAKAIGTRREWIDALFLPLGGDELKQTVASLQALDLGAGKIQLLGTGLWDEPDLGKMPLLVGGWYAAPEPDARELFIKKYNKAYNQDPPRLATLAYDATALAAVMAARGSHFDRGSLTNPNGFSGIDGIFRLTPEGYVERGLAITEVTTIGSRIVDPSLSTFASLK